MTRIFALAAVCLLALAACNPPEVYTAQVLPSACILITDQPDQDPPPGWQYWVENDGDPRGYWANTTPPFDAPRLGFSEGPTADIYDSVECSLSGGTIVGDRR